MYELYIFYENWYIGGLEYGEFNENLWEAEK